MSDEKKFEAMYYAKRAELRAYQKTYYAAHRATILAQQKARDRSVDIECPCGALVKDMRSHVRTMRHKNYCAHTQHKMDEQKDGARSVELDDNEDAPME